MDNIAAEAIGPVPGEDRITVIDCLRGAALFGILTANMRGFNAPLAAYMDPRLMWSWLPDRLMQAAVDCFVQGKFITIFAALFGIGFAIQMDRAAARVQSVGFYRRRMAGLLGIGLAHSFLLWWGDILVPYAICGFLLLLFRNCSQRTVFVWAQIMYWFVIVLIAGFYIGTLFGASPMLYAVMPPSSLGLRIDTPPMLFAAAVRPPAPLPSFFLYPGGGGSAPRSPQLSCGEL